MQPTVSTEDSLRNFSTVFTNEKAGMQHVDKEKVKRVIYEISKDSAHHQNELRKEAKVLERISSMKAIQNGLSPVTLLSREHELQPLLEQLEVQRDLSQVWLHVDMDAFYAACEERDNPQLKSVPIAIGGMSMISTANYEARKYGVRAAMPGFIAVKLCPHLKFIKLNFSKYEKAAAQARAAFAKFDPSYCVRSLDEATLRITDYCTRTGFSATQVAEEVRTHVHAATGLTCSCGTAPNSMLAKICSDMRKPNGQFHVQSTREDVMSFIELLPVRKVPGIGRVSERLLNEFGVYVVSDLYRRRGLLSYLFSSISMDFFMHVALGLGNTQQQPSDSNSEGRKSVSHEQTFTALEREEDLRSKVFELAMKVSQDLKAEGLSGKCVTLKLKQTDFRVRQRSTTMPGYIDSAESISVAASKLLSHEFPIKVRLIGVKVSSLQDSSSMTNLEVFLRKSHKSDNVFQPLSTGNEASSSRPFVCDFLLSSTVQGHKQPHDAEDLTVGERAIPVDADRSKIHLVSTHHTPIAVHCDECGANVEQQDLQEHKDMHIALALSRKMNGPSYFSPRSNGRRTVNPSVKGEKDNNDVPHGNQTKATGPLLKQATKVHRKLRKVGTEKDASSVVRIDSLFTKNGTV